MKLKSLLLAVLLLSSTSILSYAQGGLFETEEMTNADLLLNVFSLTGLAVWLPALYGACCPSCSCDCCFNICNSICVLLSSCCHITCGSFDFCAICIDIYQEFVGTLCDALIWLCPGSCNLADLGQLINCCTNCCGFGSCTNCLVNTHQEIVGTLCDAIIWLCPGTCNFADLGQLMDCCGFGSCINCLANACQEFVGTFCDIFIWLCPGIYGWICGSCYASLQNLCIGSTSGCLVGYILPTLVPGCYCCCGCPGILCSCASSLIAAVVFGCGAGCYSGFGFLIA